MADWTSSPNFSLVCSSTCICAARYLLWPFGRQGVLPQTMCTLARGLKCDWVCRRVLLHFCNCWEKNLLWVTHWPQMSKEVRQTENQPNQNQQAQPRISMLQPSAGTGVWNKCIFFACCWDSYSALFWKQLMDIMQFFTLV